MGRARSPASGSGSAAAEYVVRSQEYKQMALALAEKELEIRKLKEEKSEYQRKYEAFTSTLKALADGVRNVAMPAEAAVAASGARVQDKKDKKDDFQDKNFPLKVHRQGKPVVADSFGKIHEKVEDTRARRLRMKREGYAIDKALRAALSGPASGPVPAVADAASGARRADDSSGASSPRAQGSAGGQSSSASGAAASAAEEEEDRSDDEETASEEPRSKKMKNRTGIVD